MSDKTVAAKMGMKSGHRLLAINAPRGYEEVLGGLPEGVRRVKSGPVDFVHLFVRSRAELAREIEGALGMVGEGNLLWVSYPKKTSGVTTDITRDVGWEPLHTAGWEPVSNVSIDDTWSALRFKRTGTIPARAARQSSFSAARSEARPKVLAVPADLIAALDREPGARERFDALAPSHRREYVTWIEEAKRPETRARRVAGTVEKILSQAAERPR